MKGETNEYDYDFLSYKSKLPSIKFQFKSSFQPVRSKFTPSPIRMHNRQKRIHNSLSMPKLTLPILKRRNLAKVSPMSSNASIVIDKKTNETLFKKSDMIIQTRLIENIKDKQVSSKKINMPHNKCISKIINTDIMNNNLQRVMKLYNRVFDEPKNLSYSSNLEQFKINFRNLIKANEFVIY